MELHCRSTVTDHSLRTTVILIFPVDDIQAIFHFHPSFAIQAFKTHKIIIHKVSPLLKQNKSVWRRATFLSQSANQNEREGKYIKNGKKIALIYNSE